MSQRIELNETFKQIREHLHFVLVEPEGPGNVGSVARAMKTTGFEKLTLVNPCDLDNGELRMMAHRSRNIVNNATIVNSFAEAIGDKKLVVATTMRPRYFKFPFYSPEEISKKLLKVAIDNPVAIVFGRESSGLYNEELLQCQLHSTIATATQNPALNLAQSVMIYAHTFFMNMNKVDNKYEYNLATHYEIETFYDHLADSLKNVNFVPRDGFDDFISRVRRLIGRSLPEQRDVRLLHKMLQIFETRINDLEKQFPVNDRREIY